MQGKILSGFTPSNIEIYILGICAQVTQRADVFFQAAQKNNPAVIECESQGGGYKDVTAVTRYYQQWPDGSVVLYGKAKLIPETANGLVADSGWINPDELPVWVDSEIEATKQTAMTKETSN